MFFFLLWFLCYMVFVDFKLEHQDTQSNGQSTYIKTCNAPRQYINTEFMCFALSCMRYIVVGGVRKLQTKKSYTSEDIERVREEWVT